MIKSEMTKIKPYIIKKVITLVFAVTLLTGILPEFHLFSYVTSIIGVDDNLLPTKVEAADVHKPTNLDEWRRISADDNQLKALAEGLSKFDSREYGIVPAVKSQGNYNLCWAFGSTAAAEISILKEGFKTGKTANNLCFSELNTAFRAVNKETNPYPGTTPETFLTDYWNKGRTVASVTNLYTQWRGPVEENETTGGFRYLGDDYPTKYLMESMIRLPRLKKGDEEGVRLFKEYVLKYGAVSIAYEYSDIFSKYYYNSDGESTMGHQVAIVGWDDTISASLFTPRSASRDGAWLIRDSWGPTAHGTGRGYFWLSYDSPLVDCVVYDFGEQIYDYNYYYDSDPNTGADFKVRQEYALLGNIYKAVMGTPSMEEELRAVNVGIYGNNADVTIYIYTGLKNVNTSTVGNPPNDPLNGTLVNVTKKHLDYMGFYTIELNEPVPLKRGEYFSIVIKAQNPEGKATLYYSRDPASSTNDLSYYYVASKKEWISTKIDEGVNAVARIKAYTKMVPREDTLEKHIKNANVIIESTDFIYDGYEKTPKVDVSYDSVKLTEGEDYILAYENNVRPGKGVIHIIGQKEFAGQAVDTEFTINKGEYPYGGVPGDQPMHDIYEGEAFILSELCLPDGWVYDTPDLDLTTLELGRQHGVPITYIGADADCYNNTTASAWIKVMSGNRTGGYTLSEPSLAVTEYKYTGYPIKPNEEVKSFENASGISYRADQGFHYYVTYEGNIEPGEACAVIRPISGSVLSGGQKEYRLYYSIKASDKISLSDATLSYQKEGHEYAFEPITPNVTVTVLNKVLQKDTDYILSYSDNEGAGKGRITVLGIGAYEGVKSDTFTIVDPNAPSSDTTGPSSIIDEGTLEGPINPKEETSKDPLPQPPAPTPNYLYRYSRPDGGDWLITCNKEEIDVLKAAGWNNDGVVGKVGEWGKGTAVIRFYNKYTNDRMYSNNDIEINNYVNASAAGWVKEGPAFYTSSTAKTQVIRYATPTGVHIWSIDLGEQKNFDAAGWTKEGEAFRVD